jgi:hypothetical protein
VANPFIGSPRFQFAPRVYPPERNGSGEYLLWLRHWQSGMAAYEVASATTATHVAPWIGRKKTYLFSCRVPVMSHLGTGPVEGRALSSSPDWA